ncbi:MAG: hypothetical protein ACWGQW_08320 [bacterium]
MEKMMEYADAWIKSQKDFMEKWSKSQKDMMDSWTEATKKFQESIATMSGSQESPIKEMIGLYNSWLASVVNSSQNFAQEAEKIQKTWEGMVEKQIEMSREIVKKMSEFFKQASEKK